MSRFIVKNKSQKYTTSYAFNSGIEKENYELTITPKVQRLFKSVQRKGFNQLM